MDHLPCCPHRSGQGETKEPSPRNSKASKKMCGFHQPAVVVGQADLVVRMVIIEFLLHTGGPHLGLDVVDVADDDVDDPLGDRGEVPEQQHHGDHSAGNLPCSFGRLKIRKVLQNSFESSLVYLSSPAHQPGTDPPPKQREVQGEQGPSAASCRWPPLVG